MNDQSKFAKWFWRLLRWSLIALAILATLAAVLITEENWRGKRDWQAYQRAAAARGEHFDWSFLKPASVPDDQNFLKAPIFSGLSNQVWNETAQVGELNSTNLVDPLKMTCYRSDGSSPPGLAGSWEHARLTRLENWQHYYRQEATDGGHEFPVAAQPQSPAGDVLLALTKYDPVIEELRVASRRPYSRLGAYDNDAYVPHVSLMLTWLARFKGWAQVLQLRAIAELADQRNDQALDDVQLLLRLDDHLRQEPLLIAHLVSVAITHLSLQPIYEGLAQNRWNDAQLAELEQALAAKDFLADYQFATHGERVFAIATLENQRITRQYQQYDQDKQQLVTVSLNWTPSAFFYRNELASAQLNEELLQPLVDVTNRLISPAVLRRTTASVNEQIKHYSPYNLTALMTFPGVSQSVRKFAIAQTGVDLARVACALERYRLAHGEYPAAIDSLAPQFIASLPHDVINGQPLQYRRTEDGKFVLYSVGWNEKDDGGTVALTKSGTVDYDQGDWVWEYPGR